MANRKSQSRFQWLRRREEEGKLIRSQRAELDQLIDEMDRAEAILLHPSAEREEAECQRLEAQNAELEAVVRYQESLHSKLEGFLVKSVAGRRVI